MAKNFWVLSMRVAVNWSWVIIQEILRFVAWIETLGFFQALARDILSPNNIKKIKACVCFGMLLILWFSSAILGSWGIGVLVTFRTRAKKWFQNPWIHGHVHQI